MSKILERLTLKRLVNNKKFLIVISILISIVIWFVAMIVRNPVREQSFTNVQASISVENTSAQTLGLGIVSDISNYSFTVTISGPNYIVSSVKPEDFLLSASVEDVNAPGTYSLSVTATRNSDKTGYSFSSIEPPSIDVTFDYIDTKEFTVAPKITGVVAESGLIAEAPVMSNPEQSTITVKGPRAAIEKIESVGTLTELDESKPLSSSQTFDSDIVIYGENNTVLYRFSADGTVYDAKGEKTQSTLNLSFTSAKVTQPISKKTTLDVKVSFTNLPSGISEADIKWSIDNSKVAVIGTPEVIDKMTEVKLSAIDFRNVSSANGSFEVAPVLTDGVKIFDNIEFFTVTIDVSNFAERTFTVKNIKYSGLDSGLKAKTSSVRNVKICGPKDVVKNVTSADLYAEIDVSGKAAGAHTIDATVKSDKYNNIWQVGTYSPSVTITK